jgi:polyphenol oxidase
MQLISDFSRVHWLRQGETLARFEFFEIKVGFEGRGVNSPTNYHALRQVHSSDIVEASLESAPGSQRLPQADAIYTRARGVCVGVRTADCLPILMADEKRQFAIAIHAGWRGLSSGIVNKALNKFVALGGNTSELLVAIGPAISPAHYEVGPEVISAFDLKNLGLTETQMALGLRRGSGDRWFIDLASLAVCVLLNGGIQASNTYVLRTCTFSESEHWNSYRREGKGVASNHSWIFI